MKKLSAIIVSFICVLTIMCGCSNNNDKNGDWVCVYSVSYATGNGTETLYSQYEINANLIEISFDEFETIKIKVCSSASDRSYLNSKRNFTRDKKTQGFYTSSLSTGDIIGYQFLGDIHDSTKRYYRGEVSAFYTWMIHVKILDNRTIMIRSEEGEQKVCTDYYNIEYFN